MFRHNLAVLVWDILFNRLPSSFLTIQVSIISDNSDLLDWSKYMTSSGWSNPKSKLIDCVCGAF